MTTPINNSPQPPPLYLIEAFQNLVKISDALDKAIDEASGDYSQSSIFQKTRTAINLSEQNFYKLNETDIDARIRFRGATAALAAQIAGLLDTSSALYKTDKAIFDIWKPAVENHNIMINHIKFIITGYNNAINADVNSPGSTARLHFMRDDLDQRRAELWVASINFDGSDHSKTNLNRAIDLWNGSVFNYNVAINDFNFHIATLKSEIVDYDFRTGPPSSEQQYNAKIDQINKMRAARNPPLPPLPYTGHLNWPSNQGLPQQGENGSIGARPHDQPVFPSLVFYQDPSFFDTNVFPLSTMPPLNLLTVPSDPRFDDYLRPVLQGILFYLTNNRQTSDILDKLTAEQVAKLLGKVQSIGNPDAIMSKVKEGASKSATSGAGGGLGTFLAGVSLDAKDLQGAMIRSLNDLVFAIHGIKGENAKRLGDELLFQALIEAATSAKVALGASTETIGADQTKIKPDEASANIIFSSELLKVVSGLVSSPEEQQAFVDAIAGAAAKAGVTLTPEALDDIKNSTIALLLGLAGALLGKSLDDPEVLPTTTEAAAVVASGDNFTTQFGQLNTIFTPELVAQGSLDLFFSNTITKIFSDAIDDQIKATKLAGELSLKQFNSAEELKDFLLKDLTEDEANNVLSKVTAVYGLSFIHQNLGVSLADILINQGASASDAQALAQQRFASADDLQKAISNLVGADKGKLTLSKLSEILAGGLLTARFGEDISEGLKGITKANPDLAETITVDTEKNAFGVVPGHVQSPTSLFSSLVDTLRHVRSDHDDKTFNDFVDKTKDAQKLFTTDLNEFTIEKIMNPAHFYALWAVQFQRGGPMQRTVDVPV